MNSAHTQLGSPAAASLFDTFSRLFAVDLRALASLRIAVAVALMIDCAGRFGTLTWFLSDDRFFTRELNGLVTPPADGFWSLYWLHGSPVWAYALLIVTLLAAVWLMLGVQARWAACACLVLAWSLQVRMPLVLTAGHVLLRMLLVWLALLPSDRVWSLAARRQPPPANFRFLSVATAGLLLQVACMYLFSGIAKWNEIWLRGDAIYLAMQLDMYVKPLGRALLESPGVCQVLTWATLLLEITGPLLLFVPLGTRYLRVGLLGAFWALHLGVWTTMSIGIFSLVAMLAWLPFIPEDGWSALTRRRRSIPPHSADHPTTADPNQRASSLTTWLATSVLVYTITLHVANAFAPSSSAWFPIWARRIGNAAMVTQEFKMFDRPSRWSYCWRLVHRNSADQCIDYFGGRSRLCSSPTEWPSSEQIYASFPNHYWRRVFFNLAYFADAATTPNTAIARMKKALGESTLAAWGPSPQGSDPPPPATLLLLRREVDRWGEPQPGPSEVWAQR